MELVGGLEMRIVERGTGTANLVLVAVSRLRLNNDINRDMGECDEVQ